MRATRSTFAATEAMRPVAGLSHSTHPMLVAKRRARLRDRRTPSWSFSLARGLKLLAVLLAAGAVAHWFLLLEVLS